MLTQLPPTDCLMAREAASARVDGELSELEAARLDAHLATCADCRDFAAQAAALVREVRRAPAEQPRTPIVLARPRRLGLSSWAAAASVLLAVTGSSFALGHLIGGRSPEGPAALGRTEVVDLRRDSAHQHVLALSNAFSAPQAQAGPMRAI